MDQKLPAKLFDFSVLPVATQWRGRPILLPRRTTMCRAKELSLLKSTGELNTKLYFANPTRGNIHHRRPHHREATKRPVDEENSVE